MLSLTFVTNNNHTSNTIKMCGQLVGEALIHSMYRLIHTYASIHVGHACTYGVYSMYIYMGYTYSIIIHTMCDSAVSQQR